MGTDDTPRGTDEGSDAPAGGHDLQTRRLRYQEAFEFAPDCQLVTDAQGLVLEANHAAAVLVGHRKEFLIEKPLALFATEGSRARFYECLRHMGKGSPTDTFEARLTRRGEGPREAQVIARAGEAVGDRTTADSIHWLIRDVTEWHRADAARDELQRRLTTAQEDERRRVARDLHDTIGQTLTALALGLQAVRDGGPLPESTLARLTRAERLTDDLARQVHDLATRLRPTALDDLGLEAAARQLVTDWSADTQVASDFQIVGWAGQRFPPEVETALYRVVQESLTNIAKHAGARRVAVVIGRSAGQAVAMVEDDGIGFDPEGIGPPPAPGEVTGERGHLGLLGMRERVTLLDGTLEIESTPGQGTAIITRIPLPAD